MNNLLHSIRFRLTLWYASVLALVLVLFAASVYVFVVRSLQTNIDQALQGYGRQVTQVAGRTVQGGHLNVNHISMPPGVRREPLAVVIMNVEGKALRVQPGHAGPPYQVLRIAIRSGKQSCTTLQATGIGMRHEPIRVCTTLEYRHGRRVGGVAVAESLVGVNRALERLRLALILGIPFALILAGWGGWLLAGRALEPVERIARLARSISSSDLSRRIDLRRQDELGRLADTFDAMIERLERSFAEQRQLTADVSHELRSPLAIIEAQTTLALRRSRTDEEYRHILASVQEEVERMSCMVAQLLSLARAEAGEEPVAMEPLDLLSLSRAVVDALEPVARERGVALDVNGDAVLLLGDSARLRQAVLNLVQNALQFTPEGGRVAVTAGCRGRQAVLQVRDTGCGIAAEHIPGIFQRFYRVDPARSRSTGNSGLGLTIVRWIVEAHGGEIEVDSQVGGGSTFTILLPMTHQPAPA